MDGIRIGVIGAGEVADRHVEGLLRAKGVSIHAVAEPDEGRRARFAKVHGVEHAAADHRELLDSPEVDLVLVLTPHDSHATISIAALEAGKHVICEKPMAPTSEECDRMLESAARAKRTLWVTHSLRADFFYRIARRRIEDGALGRVVAALFRWFTDELARLEDATHWKGTRDRSGGGVLIDGGCHVADIANALLGQPHRVHAFGGKLVAKRDAVAEDTAAFTIEHESGAIASVLLSFTAGSSLRGTGAFGCGLDVELWGTDAWIEGGYRIRAADFRRSCIERRAGEPDRAYVDDGTRKAGDVDFEIIRALRGEIPPPVTALDARNAVAVVEAAYRAIASGKAEKVDWRRAR